MKRTLFIIKPNAVNRYNDIMGKIIASRKFCAIYFGDERLLTREDVEAFYYKHYGDDWLHELVDYMVSGPIIPICLEGENAIEDLMELVGPTDSNQASEDTVRGMLKLGKNQNGCHRSDSEESAAEEVPFFFPDLLPMLEDEI